MKVVAKISAAYITSDTPVDNASFDVNWFSSEGNLSSPVTLFANILQNESQIQSSLKTGVAASVLEVSTNASGGSPVVVAVNDIRLF